MDERNFTRFEFTMGCLIYRGHVQHDNSHKTTITMVTPRQDFLLTNDTPYTALTGEVWGVFLEFFKEKWSRYIESTLYSLDISQLYWWQSFSSVSWPSQSSVRSAPHVVSLQRRMRVRLPPPHVTEHRPHSSHSPHKPGAGAKINGGTDSKFAPSQWETVLLCNDVFHWLGTGLESALEWSYRWLSARLQ